MAFRPLNRCRSCGYTWYPRGKNVSLRCPGCGSTAVEVATLSPTTLGVGCLGLIILACCGGLLQKLGLGNKPAGADRGEVARATAPDRKDEGPGAPRPTSPSTPSIPGL